MVRVRRMRRRAQALGALVMGLVMIGARMTLGVMAGKPRAMPISPQREAGSKRAARTTKASNKTAVVILGRATTAEDTTTGSSTSNSWPTTNASSLYNNSHRSNNSGSRSGAPFVDASPAQYFGSGSGSGCVGKLKPDGAWSEDDCEVLEWLMNRYKEDKWLHIQSGFYNWTKRMVSWEIIEQKFKDDGAL